MLKTLYTLRRQRNEAVDTNMAGEHILAEPKLKAIPSYTPNFKGQGHYSMIKGQNQGQTMVLHTYKLQPMSLPSINFLHLTVSEI